MMIPKPNWRISPSLRPISCLLGMREDLQAAVSRPDNSSSTVSRRLAASRCPQLSSVAVGSSATVRFLVRGPALGKAPRGRLSDSSIPLDRARTCVHTRLRGHERRCYVGLLLYLAQSGQRGNEAFLGIGIIGWVIIVVLLALALYFFMRSRRRGVLDRLMGRRRRGF